MSARGAALLRSGASSHAHSGSPDFSALTSHDRSGTRLGQRWGCVVPFVVPEWAHLRSPQSISSPLARLTRPESSAGSWFEPSIAHHRKPAWLCGFSCIWGSPSEQYRNKSRRFRARRMPVGSDWHGVRAGLGGPEPTHEDVPGRRPDWGRGMTTNLRAVRARRSGKPGIVPESSCCFARKASTRRS